MDYTTLVDDKRLEDDSGAMDYGLRITLKQASRWSTCLFSMIFFTFTQA